MLNELPIKIFRQSVRALFISQISSWDFFISKRVVSFNLNKLGILGSPSFYDQISSWEAISQRSKSFLPITFLTVNKAYSDKLNKYEAAALIICKLLKINTDEQRDHFLYEEKSEYAALLSCFDDSLSTVRNNLKILHSRGYLRAEVWSDVNVSFATIFEKYPELEKAEPPEPEKIEWWELSYNNAQEATHRIIGHYENVIEVVEHVAKAEGTKDLFWDYPANLKCSEWEPTVPPPKDFQENAVFAIPRRGWDSLWKKYEGIMFGSNIDHWQSIRKTAYVRPKDSNYIKHKIMSRPYQANMFD